MVKNQIAKSRKVEKLREVLLGFAQKFIPSNFTGSIDDAWSELDKAFGDQFRPVRFKKEALLKLGELPKLTSGNAFKAQVLWYLEVEALLKDLIELGSRSDRLYSEAFCDTTIRSIYRMFPVKLMHKLIKCQGNGKENVEAILIKISELRSKAQEVLIVEETGPDFGCSAI